MGVPIKMSEAPIRKIRDRLFLLSDVDEGAEAFRYVESKVLEEGTPGQGTFIKTRVYIDGLGRPLMTESPTEWTAVDWDGSITSLLKNN